VPTVNFLFEKFNLKKEYKKGDFLRQKPELYSTVTLFSAFGLVASLHPNRTMTGYLGMK